MPETSPLKLAASFEGLPSQALKTSLSVEGGGDSISFAGTLGTLGRQVEEDVAARQDRPGALLASTHQCPDPCQQLLEGEWLAEVIIGPGVEPVDAVGDGVACRQEQDRRLAIERTEPAEEAQAVLAKP